MRTALAKRLDQRLDKLTNPKGCWVWKGYRTPFGYGKLTPGPGQSSVRVHRLAWELKNGPIPPGMHVLHRCDNPPCCNPAHLWLGTQQDNMADKIAKGRQHRGEQTGGVKLSEEEVLQIRNAVGSYTELADEFGVSPSMIGFIKTRKSWKHLP